MNQRVYRGYLIAQQFNQKWAIFDHGPAGHGERIESDVDSAEACELIIDKYVSGDDGR